ncbi:hypothetical protein BJ912DRAFT_968419 [Pholiota molesta]|nr:hypothetical protein BJ912DRAFT_968419 [Pholiota molesta]
MRSLFRTAPTGYGDHDGAKWNLVAAFSLLNVPNVSFSGTGLNPDTGVLDLQCSTRSEDRDVYLVIRIDALEMPIDPARIVTLIDGSKTRSYTFSGTPSDPSELVLSVRGPFIAGDELVETLETFENILEQYVAEFRVPEYSTSSVEPLTAGQVSVISDLRGRLVMINEDTGEIIGEVEDSFKIKEDPSLLEKGHEDDPVFIQVPEGYTRDTDRHALEAFASIIPPDQRNWISTSANIVSHAISMTTNLLITTITTGASLYVSHSAPLHTTLTRKGLSTVHALSGEAVKVSSKTVALIDSMIRRAMGAKPKRARYFATGADANAHNAGLLSPNKSPLPSRTPSPTPSTRSAGAVPPPPYTQGPFIPPRRSLSPAPPLPPRAGPSAYAPPPTPGQQAPPLPERRLKTKDHILISADLILSTIDDSARRQIGRVMGHKYGPEAAESSLHLAGTARNVGLVYIDMSGIGRRALLKRAGKTFIKARLSSNDPHPYPQPVSVPAPKK